VVVVSCCRCRPRAKRSLVADGGGSLRRQFDHGGVRHGDRIRRGRQLLGLSGHDERMAERAHRLASEKTPSVLRKSQKTYSAGLNNQSHGPAPYPAKDRSRVCFGRHRVGGLEKISRSWLGCAIFGASSSRSLALGWAVGSVYPRPLHLPPALFKTNPRTIPRPRTASPGSVRPRPRADLGHRR
jgi:hypothetical protein